MCGFAGFVGSAETINRVGEDGSLVRLLDRLRSRGPDAIEYWSDTHVAIGHARLALRDLSPSGRQPAQSPSSRYVLLYNGNLLSTAGLTDGCPAWQGDSVQDTAAIALGLDRFGIAETINRLDGMYAIAIWDRALGELTLARDPFGLKPLCYARFRRGLWFGSTLHALPCRSAAQWSLAVDPGALALAISLGCAPAPRTPFRDVNKLMPGERRRYTRMGVLVSTETRSAARQILGDPAAPWDPANQVDEEEFRSALEKSVAGAAESSGPIGLLLSGGIDSSLIAVALADKGIPFRAYALGFDLPEYDETDAAATVARILGVQLKVVRPNPSDIVRVAQRLSSAFDEPLGDPSMIPTLLLCERVSKDVRTALSGEGADELFAGYARQHALAARWSGGPLDELPESRSETAASLSDRFARWRRPRAAGLEAGPRVADYDALAVMTLPELSSEGSVSWAPYLALDLAELAAASPPRAAKALEMAATFPNLMATKIDRAGMAHGLEVRPPFLSREILSLAVRHADSSHRSGSLTKFPLRRRLAETLPPSIWNRPKRGFSPPLDNWLRGSLREWAQDLLHSATLSMLPVDRAATLRIWASHLSGGNYARAIWPILSSLQWLDGLGSGDRG